MNSTNAGWYKDPNGNPCERLWDGENWTDRTRPLQAAGDQVRLLSLLGHESRWQSICRSLAGSFLFIFSMIHANSKLINQK